MKACGYLLRCLVLFLSFLLVFPAGTVSAAAGKAQIKHDPPGGSYIPGFRINLDAMVKDSAEILTARCYFKTKDDKNFGFVQMTGSGDDHFKAVLPAPFVGSEEVQYLFVSVNKAKQVTRTKVFTLKEAETKEGIKWKDINEVREVRLDEIQDTAEKFALLYEKSKGAYIKDLAGYQSASASGAVQVGTELPANQVPLNGFYDQVSVQQVPAAARYGLVADGLYTADAAAKAGGAGASGATSAGVAAAGVSSTAMVGGLVGLAVIGGGAALAAGGGSDGGGSTGGSSGGSTGGLTTADLVGTWNLQQTGTSTLSGWHSASSGYQFISTSATGGTWTGSASSGCGGLAPLSVNGSWTFNESSQTLTMTDSTGNSAEANGTISGTASSFTVPGTIPASGFTANDCSSSYSPGASITLTFTK